MILGIHHATLLTSDLAKARAFYEGVLELQLSPSRPQMSFDGVWYDFPNNQQIHLMQLPNPETGIHRPAHGGREHHVALLVEDLSRLKSRLDGVGIAYTQSQSGRKALFCRDPDLNALEFIEVVK